MYTRTNPQFAWYEISRDDCQYIAYCYANVPSNEWIDGWCKTVRDIMLAGF